MPCGGGDDSSARVSRLLSLLQALCNMTTTLTETLLCMYYVGLPHQGITYDQYSEIIQVHLATYHHHQRPHGDCLLLFQCCQSGV